MAHARSAEEVALLAERGGVACDAGAILDAFCNGAPYAGAAMRAVAARCRYGAVPYAAAAAALRWRSPLAACCGVLRPE